MTLRHLAILPLLAALAPGQNDFDLDKTTSGTLGTTLSMAVRNAPANALLLSMPSFSGGPTPIALFDPADPRSIQVGIDLASNWNVLVASPTGTASIVLGLPANPGYQGIVLHWQTVTFPGTTTIIDRISNDVVAQIGLVDSNEATPGGLATARALAAAFANPLTNAGMGDVVIAGGGTGSLTAAVGLASTEIWDFRHLRARPGPTMTVARALHVAVPIANNRVLLIGGVNSLGTPLASCEIYDPVTNTFAATGSMATARTLHAATRLGDGRVLVAGGTSSLVDPTAAITNTQSSCEVWNPATGTWSGAPAMGGPRLGPALTTLPNGRAMVSGGVQIGFLFGVPISAVSTTAVQIYNYATNTWGPGAAMPNGRAGHHYNQVSLLDNRVLMTGGVYVPSLLGATTAGPIAAADLYNPTSDSWTQAPMTTPRSLHSASRLPDGRIVVCGGAQGSFTAPIAIGDVEIFQPSSNSWTTLTPLAQPRSGHVATVQPDGLVVLIGGQDASATTPSARVLHF